MKIDEDPVVVEQIFDQPIEIVWKAITNINEMRQWFFENIPEFTPEVGFKTQFIVSTENHVFPHLWEITEVIPKHKIVYNWKYEGYQGDSYVTFELSETNYQTQLTLTTKVIENFSDDIPEFKRESCLSGWNYFIKTSLLDYLKDKL